MGAAAQIDDRRAIWRSAAVMGPDDGDVERRALLDSPWMASGPNWRDPAADWPRRLMFERVFNRLHRGLSRPERTPPIALVGPRRTGKTILLRQAAARLLEVGVAPSSVQLLDAAAPALSGRRLDEAAGLLAMRAGAEPTVLLLDHAERRTDWPAELRRLRARFPGAVILAASSLAPTDDGAAGLGELDVLALPPIGFAEYLRLTGSEKSLLEPMSFGGRTMYAAPDPAALDRAFLAWLNGGGFPEAVLLPAAAAGGDGSAASARLRAQVIPLMLDEGLAARYGVADPAELQGLFVRLARNTGGELSVEELATACGLAKNTVRRYLDHLCAAGLIWRMPRVHPAGGRFRRMRTFKVHLTAPCLFAALFGPVGQDHAALPALTETGVLAQWQGSRRRADLHFARLPEGPVDLIGLDPDSLRPAWACALPGSDESLTGAGIEGLIAFARRNAPLRWLGATTRTKAGLRSHGGLEVWHRPVGQYCYEIGRRMGDETG